MRNAAFGFALAAAVGGLGGNAAAADIQPGMALPPEDVPAEAQHFERIGPDQGADGEAGSLLRDGDTVDERRHFDDRIFHAGAGTGLGTPVGIMGAFVEANPSDALALGAGGGVTFWGPSAGGYVRWRPYVWGGEGRNLLNAFTLQTSYTYMLHGRDPLGDIDFSLQSDCEVAACPEPKPEFVPRGAHFMSLSAGFEHALYSGWTFRYDFGFAATLGKTSWECAMNGRPTPCTNSSPMDAILVAAFGISHAL